MPRNDYFASSVALSRDGNKKAIGAMFADKKETSEQQGGDSEKSGMAYLFDSDGTVLASLTSPIQDLDNHFGISVSMNADGDQLLVGAPHVSKQGRDPNIAAFLFDKSGTILKYIRTPTQSEGIKENMQFGGSVVLASTGGSSVISSAFHPVVKYTCLNDGQDGACSRDTSPEILKRLPVDKDEFAIVSQSSDQYLTYNDEICNAIPVNRKPPPTPFHRRVIQEPFLIGITMAILCAVVLIVSRLYVRRTVTVRSNAEREVNLHTLAEDFPPTPQKAVLPEII
jgi:hypothetical protein